ncbi:MAG: hypothetical protein KGJ06_07665 [Pseudomonadota bacterium]|nr:hypothetical protein [Pseudomonadota bacterium]
MQPETQDALSQLADNLQELEQTALSRVENGARLRRAALETGQRQREYYDILHFVHMADTARDAQNYVSQLAGRAIGEEIDEAATMKALGESLARHEYNALDLVVGAAQTVRGVIQLVVEKHEELGPVLDAFIRERNKLGRRGCEPRQWLR